jgi:hypothetical protein
MHRRTVTFGSPIRLTESPRRAAKSPAAPDRQLPVSALGQRDRPAPFILDLQADDPSVEVSLVEPVPVQAN